MLRKDAALDWPTPTEMQVIAFGKLKHVLANPQILGFSKQGCPFMIETDASQYELGTVLLTSKNKWN